MNSFIKVIVLLAVCLIKTQSLPIDNDHLPKVGLTVNELFHKINEVIKRDVNVHLNNQHINPNGSPQEIIDILNSDKKGDDNVHINVQHFESALPTINLNFETKPDVLEHKDIETEFSNGTFSEIKVHENLVAESTTKGTAKTLEPTENENKDNKLSSESITESEESEEEEEDDHHGLICSSGELRAYMATTENYDSSEDSVKTGKSNENLESSVMKIAVEIANAESLQLSASSDSIQKIEKKTESSSTTESSTSSDSSSTSQNSSTKSSQESSTSRSSQSSTTVSSSQSSTTESSTSKVSSTTVSEEDKLMEKIAEVSAVPVILTQGV